MLRSRADSLRSCVILHERLAFYSAFLADPPVVYLQRWHGWCHMKLLPSRRVLCTPNNHAPCHFMQSHIREVYACLAVTCHLHFWQNDQGLLVLLSELHSPEHWNQTNHHAFHSQQQCSNYSGQDRHLWDCNYQESRI